MSEHYGDIAFTEAVRAVQSRSGGGVSDRQTPAAGSGPVVGDPLTELEQGFLEACDEFFLATVSETGWPYVQYRGGPPGFLRVIDEHVIGWADFRGNRQYVTTGNLSGDGRVSMIVMDHRHRQRLKLFGHARIVTIDDAPALVESLVQPDYHAVVQRAVVVAVDAFDWNCPQHITPRFTLTEIAEHIEPLQRQVAVLTAENARLRDQGPAGGDTP